ETFREAVTEKCGQGFARGDGEANAGEIEFADFATMVEKGGEIRRHGEKERGAMALDDGVDVLRRGRAGAKDGSAADSEREIQSVAEAVGEEKFCGTEETIGFGDLEDLRGVALGGHDHVVLQVNATFGEAGAAGGVEPEGGIVFTGGRGGELRVGGGEEISEGDCARRSGTNDEQMLQEGQMLARDLQDKVRERIADDSDAGTRVVEQVFVFVGAQESVEGNGYGAHLDGAEKTVGEFGNIGEEEQDALFHAHAEVAQGGSKAVHALVDLRVSDALVAAFDGDAVAAASGEMAVDKIFGGVKMRLVLAVEERHGGRV